MTEKEKLLKGQYYNTRDIELIGMHNKARKLIMKFNSKLLENLNEVLSQLFEGMEEGVWVEKPFFCDYGENISIGARSVVTKSIPSNTIVAGNHCRVVKSTIEDRGE